MAQRGNTASKKRRTRQHVIADLSINHVERFILRCGHTVQRIERDYGFDLLLFTYSGQGEVEPGQVLLQVKATEHLQALSRRQVIPWRLERADLLSWLKEPMPVFLVVYEAAQDRAYWMYLQPYFGTGRVPRSVRLQTTATVHLPVENLLDDSAIERIAQIKRRILAQAQGAITHEE